MAVSKLEINFRRLLERCETMAAELQDNKENVSWRLEKVRGAPNLDFTVITPTVRRTPASKARLIV